MRGHVGPVAPPLPPESVWLFSFTFKHLCWQILRKRPISSTPPRSFQESSSGLASPAGECVSGQTEMSTVKACRSSEGAGKWCANELLSVQWHYKWLPRGKIVTLGRKRGGEGKVLEHTTEESRAGMQDNNKWGAGPRYNMTGKKCFKKPQRMVQSSITVGLNTLTLWDPQKESLNGELPHKARRNKDEPRRLHWKC